jgi:hypothetical protein
LTNKLIKKKSNLTNNYGTISLHQTIVTLDLLESYLKFFGKLQDVEDEKDAKKTEAATG